MDDVIKAINSSVLNGIVSFEETYGYLTTSNDGGISQNYSGRKGYLFHITKDVQFKIHTNGSIQNAVLYSAVPTTENATSVFIRFLDLSGVVNIKNEDVYMLVGVRNATDSYLEIVSYTDAEEVSDAYNGIAYGIETKLKPLYVPYYCNTSDGQLQNATLSLYGYLIKVISGATYTFSGIELYHQIFAYSEYPTIQNSQSVLIGMLADGTSNISVPANAKYILISVKTNSSMDDDTILLVDSMKNLLKLDINNTVYNFGREILLNGRIGISKPYGYYTSATDGTLSQDTDGRRGFLLHFTQSAKLKIITSDTLMNTVLYSAEPTPENYSTTFVEFLLPDDGTAQGAITVPDGDYYLLIGIRGNPPLPFEIQVVREKPQLDKFHLQKIEENNPLKEVMKSPGFGSIIHSWGVVGDSLASGSIESYVSGHHTWGITDYNFSWGQRLFKLLGVDGYNFSIGSQTCWGWLNNYGPSERNWNGAQTNPKDAYIIALGFNDPKGSDTNPAEELGDESDINLSDYTQNANTFYGLYAGIIQRLRSIVPKSYIFVVTSPKRINANWNNAIKYMATIFDNCYVIDLAQYSQLFNDNDFSDAFFMGTHMTPAGYQYVAYMMNTYIDYIIRNNFDDFKGSAYIQDNTQEPF